MTTTNDSRFRRGSGCYACGNCGRMTRETGNCESNGRTCADCYELGGIENEILDCGDPDTIADLQAECATLRARIIAKGGKLPEGGAS